MPYLFSYGTLQQESVQLTTFGRVLRGSSDQLVGFHLAEVQIRDQDFVAASGKAVHANAVFDGKRDSRVAGTVFEVTDQELSLCDEYERPAEYERVSAELASSKVAWVYVYSPPANPLIQAAR